MTSTQRLAVQLLSVAALAVGLVWLFRAPDYEPVTVVLLGAAGLLSTWWPRLSKRFARTRFTGRISFDYSSNNGRYVIGRDELQFETAWSKASDTSIHIYNDPPSIDGVALVRGVPRISDIPDASGYDFSSRSRTAEEGDIVILKNKYGNFAALKVVDIKDCTRSDPIDEVTFEYVINPNGKKDFR